MEGRGGTEKGGERRGAHDCISRLNRLKKNKYKVCQASFLPTLSVRLSIHRQVRPRPALPRSVGRPHRLVGYDHPHGGNGCRRPRPTCNPSEVDSPSASSSSRGHYFDTQIMLSGRGRGSKKPVMKCMKRRGEKEGSSTSEEERRKEGRKGKHLC